MAASKRGEAQVDEQGGEREHERERLLLMSLKAPIKHVERLL